MSTSPARIGLALLALCALAGSRAVAAEATGSGLDDEALEASHEVDERGLSALTPVRRRSPGGLLYPFPYEPPAWTSAGGLDWRGFAELGYLGNTERDPETRFEEYVDWSDGLLLRDFFLDARATEGGAYAHFESGSAGRDDAFYRAELGRRGWLKLGLFYDEVPHVLANDARSPYQGIGSEQLTLPAPLGTALAAAGEQQLAIQRDRAGASLSLRATPELSLSGHYRRERRTGERPFGGAIFFSFPFQPPASNGSVVETVEPIDTLTHSFGGGLQYAGKRVQANLAYRGSAFDNHDESLTWENPFTLFGAQVPAGRAALAPDNRSHGLHGDLGVALPWQGRWTASAAWNRMTQGDDLLPGTINSAAFPAWDTTASLRDGEAHARVETWLLDSSLRLRPARPLTARLHLRWFERNDHTDYDAYNPLLDQYGYVPEDGRFGVTPRYGPVPFDHSRLLSEGSLVWRAPFGANLELEYAREQTERSHRARDTREEIGRASLTSRRLGPATLRVAYELRDRRGGSYDTAHDAAYYAPGTPPVILPGFRQLDLASRFQHELQARVNLALGSSVDLSLAAMVRNADFDADHGRDFERGRELNLEVGWQPSPRLELHAFGSAEKRVSRLNTVDYDAPTLSFPAANEWIADSDGSTLGLGTGFRAKLLPRLELSGDYSWLRSRDQLDYAFDPSAGALAAATTAAEAGSGLPRLRTRDQVLRLAAELALSERWTARLFYRFEHSRLEDPQQRGLVPLIRQTLYLGHVDDDFEASVVGVSLTLRF